MRFVKLTGSDAKPVYVNMDRVLHIKPSEDAAAPGAEIYMNIPGDTVSVIETPEKVIALAKDIQSQY